MYRIFSYMAAFLAVITLAAACTPQAASLSLNADSNDKQVEIKSGGEITITLDGNPSTGYTWEAKDLDTSMFEVVGDPVFTSSNPDLIGSGGALALTFKTLKAGTSTLMLIYHRPWETDVEPIDTFSVSVTVK
jgi:inhibitor of cysteine peptidase